MFSRATIFAFHLYLSFITEAATLPNNESGPRQFSPRKSTFITTKTLPFLVNGSALPNVNFDIGESFSGLLPIDDTDKELFFWFMPSRNPSSNNEITIWLNGGPGCSSLYGFFREQGPVLWRPGNFAPTANPWAWVNQTNMVWIDQPVGAGFSQGTPNVTSSEELAIQFLAFWKNFVDLFGLDHRKVFITGESYAGQYIPYIAAAMLDQHNDKYFNVSGIMMYDPSFGWYDLAKQVPIVAFTDAHRESFALNDTFTAHIHNRSSACGYDSLLANGLVFPPTGPLPPVPGLGPDGKVTSECDIYNEIYLANVELNPCFDIYEIGKLCPKPWDVLESPEYYNGNMPPNFEPYFNRTEVKAAIHAPLDSHWGLCTSRPVFTNYTDLSSPSGITGGPLQRVIEATNNVVISHGTMDMILMVNGSLLTLQNLTWNGVQGFSSPPSKPFIVPKATDRTAGFSGGSGVFGLWVQERGLTFCTVELSGHEVPAYQPSAAFRQLEFLLGRIDNLTIAGDFVEDTWLIEKGKPVDQMYDHLIEDC